MSELNFLHSNGNKVKLTTPDTLAANKTFKLPGVDGSSGQVLSTNGSGTLSFISSGVGTDSSINTSGIITATHFSTTENTYEIDYLVVGGGGQGGDQHGGGGGAGGLKY